MCYLHILNPIPRQLWQLNLKILSSNKEMRSTTLKYPARKVFFYIRFALFFFVIHFCQKFSPNLYSIFKIDMSVSRELHLFHE